MRKVLIVIGLLVLVLLISTISPPHAADFGELKEDTHYELYDSEIWSETINSVVENHTESNKSYMLDLGTRTQDGSMHIYIQSVAPDTSYELSVDNITLEERQKEADSEKSEKGIVIDASMEQKEDVGNQIITKSHQHIELKEDTQTDLDYVQSRVTDGWGDEYIFEREACGCVMEQDPKQN